MDNFTNAAGIFVELSRCANRYKTLDRVLEDWSNAARRESIDTDNWD